MRRQANVAASGIRAASLHLGSSTGLYLRRIGSRRRFLPRVRHTDCCRRYMQPHVEALAGREWRHEQQPGRMV